jgi:RHS repeat-associated protein
MRWMRHGGGAGDGMSRLRSCLAVLMIMGAVFAAPTVSAQLTQQAAISSCDAQLPAEYARLSQTYTVRGRRCAVTDPVNAPNWYTGQVEVDLYGIGLFFWLGTNAQAVYSDEALDPIKGCGIASGPGGMMCPAGLRTEGPIDLVTGNKYKIEQDVAASGSSDLSFDRYYLGDDVARTGGMFGARWRSEYDRRIEPMAGTGTLSVIAFRESGQGLYFNSSGGASYTSDKDSPYKFEKLFSGSTHTGWRLTDPSDRVETYDAQGKLTGVTWPSGEFQTLAYDSNQRLSTVTGRDGRKLSFVYDANGRLQTLTDPAGAVTTYAYDASTGLLATVTRPGGATRRYFYNEPGRVVSPPAGKYYLTGIEDENGQRHASYSYDSAHRAILSTLAGNAERVDVSYGSGNSVTVTDALGRTTTRSWEVAQRVAKYTGTSGLSVSNGLDAALLTYDANGYIDEVTDFRTNKTDYDHDARGLETQRIEAKTDTTGNKRTVQTDWHATYRSPIERRVRDSAGTLKAKTNWTYNSREQALTATATDPSVTPNVTRTVTYTYCEQANVTAGTCPFVGLLTSINGARTDVTDITTFTYRQADDPACATAPTTCTYRKGDLWKVTNALGHVVEVPSYDGAGRPLKIVDADSVVTDLEYHPRGWLTARKLRGTNNSVESDDQITRIEYWPTGDVKTITQPDGVSLQFAYDAAHRLTGITDNAGNTITYTETVNATGARKQEDVKDSTGTLVRTLARLYNTLGQLQTITDADHRNTGFTYDANGNLDETTDALTRKADNDYDPLDRLSRTLQDRDGANAIAAETLFAYDALDNLTHVTDPKGLNTNYTYNGFSELKTLTSPDTGTTIYSYDSAGNLASQTNANGKVTNYAYDALNRPTAVTYPQDTALNVTYLYDSAQTDCAAGQTFLKGRLAKMTDHSGSTTWCYDSFGQMTKKVQRTQGKTFALQWSYLANGRLNTMTYPDGVIVDYLYDNQGRVVEMGVTLERTGSRRQVLRNASYHPFGPVQQWTFGNGLEVRRSLNGNGQPGVIEDGPTTSLGPGLNRGYQFDAVGNVQAVRERQANPPLRTYGYDRLNRLTHADNGEAVTQNSYSYDKTGNRLTSGKRETTTTTPQDCTGVPPGGTCVPGTPITTTQWTTQSHTYWPNTHRLRIADSAERSYDAAGNLVQILPLGTIVVDDPPPPEESLDSAAYSGTHQDATTDTPAPPGVLTRTFAYSAANRMSSVSVEGEVLMSYRYTGAGERVYRSGNSEAVHTVFDPSGRWIGDYDANGVAIQQALWFGDLPVGLVRNLGSELSLHYIEADALGTPRVVIEPNRGAQGTVVWQWDLTRGPFGEDRPNDDPDGDGNAFVLDMRFPGQQYDSATGFNYNYFRDYDPSTGRYTQSDPIGLLGGINTYSYVGGNPLQETDRLGLDPGDLFDTPEEAEVDKEAYFEARNGLLYRLFNPRPVLSDVYQPEGCYGLYSYQEAGVAAGTAPGVGFGRAISAARAARAFKFSGWKKITVDMKHIADRHIAGGSLTAGRDIFVGMNQRSVMAAIRQAYANATTLKVQGERVLLSGVSKAGVEVRMWYNKTTRTIETAYPRIAERLGLGKP